MKTVITGRNTVITPAITDRVMKKTERMGRYLRQDAEMQIRLTKNKDDMRIAEITIPMGNHVILRSEGREQGNLFRAIDEALAKMERQIHKHRTKLERNLREDAFQSAPEYIEEEEIKEEQAQILRRKTFPMRPMSVEDAAIQMELLGHSFFAFVNMDTGAVNVLYQRKEGGLGLLEPET